MPNRFPPPPGLPPDKAAAGFPPKVVNNPANPCGTPPPPKAKPAVVPPTPVAPLISMRSPVVLVKKSYMPAPIRRMVLLRVDQPFDGTGTFTVTGGAAKIKFFRLHKGGAEIKSGHVFSGKQLTAGVPVFAQGEKPSASMNDITIELSLKPGSAPVKPPAKAKMTAVEVTLDICKSRTKSGVDPEPLSTINKIKRGRYLQVQDVGTNAGRAMLIVRKAVPSSFTGKLVLAPRDARVRVFAAADDPPASGQVPLATLDWLNANIPAKGLKLWAEGVSVSGASRDTGFQLGVDGVNPDGDFVNITVAQFADIKATIKPTPSHSPANATAAGLAAPADHVFQSAALSRDFAINVPLVLMRNAQPDIALRVTSAPAGLPIRWQAIRNELDHGGLGTATDVPALAPDPRNVKRAKLKAGAKGSFRIRAYIDCNDTNQYEDLIDREPSIPLNLVLANAALVKDDSAGNAGGVAGNLTTAIGASFINITNGLWANPPLTSTDLKQAGMGMKITADVTGGGADGLLGLDKVFSGLVNMVKNRDVIGTYRDTTVAPPTVHLWKFIAASNAAAATGGVAPSNFFQPGDPAPVLYKLPLLDTGRPSAGTGGETATMSRSAPHTSAAEAVGQRWTIQCIDSPGMSFRFLHPANPNAWLSKIHYHYDFIACFCFWTNVSTSRGATGDPADRLYSVLRIVDWRVVGDWNVAFAGVPPAPTLTVATPHKVKVPSRKTISPIGRAQDNGVEVRGPSGIQIAVWDGSS
jgi:hypothetical protein